MGQPPHAALKLFAEHRDLSAKIAKRFFLRLSRWGHELSEIQSFADEGLF